MFFSILILEDDPLVARSVTRVLRRVGHRVTVTTSVAEASAVTESHDLGIFDVDLPDGNGLMFAEKALTDRLVDRAVFFSDTREPEVIAHASRMGPFVTKAESIGSLLNAVADQLARLRCRKVANGDTVGEEGGPSPSSPVLKRRID